MINKLILTWLLALVSIATPVGSASAQSLPSRQILVMLKVAPDHLRIGSSYAGGASSDYGGTISQSARHRTAEGIARKNGFTLVDGWPMPLLGVDCYVMGVAPQVPLAIAVSRVSRDSRVAWSEPMELYQAQGRADQRGPDPLFAVQPASTEWKLKDLHHYANGSGVSIAIIDSSIDVHHPDLAGHFVANENFLSSAAPAPELHGTAVAGIIGATEGNGIGIAGIAPGARLMALRACWQVRGEARPPTLCESLGIARALSYAIDHKADIINLSLSGPRGILISKLITIALTRKTSVVAAFDPMLADGGFPASNPGVIAVADEALHYLPANVYEAPGQDVPTTQPGGRWYLVSGSSYAAAHVSGLIALVRQHRNSSTLVRLASGRIDACSSLLGVRSHCECPCGLPEGTRSGKR